MPGDEIQPNQAVRDYLAYYVDSSRDLDYAVLVSGPWGSGKTFLIKGFLEQTGIKSLYISLYGMTSTAQIDEEFYRQLHPVLASKGMKLLGAAARGLLKGTLKIDLNDDGKDDGSVNVSVPQFDLVKAIGDPRERLLVFDDLERCRIPVSEVLGYINSFVEHDGLKAIILANEDEIVRHSDPRFPDIKEKLIGQTLVVSAPVEQALDAFLASIQDERTIEYLTKHRSEILDVHMAAGLNNLRTLKQALWDFERVSRHFQDRHWSNDIAIAKVLNIVLAMALEHRSGRLAQGQIGKLIGNSFGRLFRSQTSGETTPEQVIEDRYPQIDFDRSVLDAATLEAVIVRGESDGAAIRATLDASAYFVTGSDQPLWSRAWNIFSSDEATALATTKEFEKAFAARQFTARGEVLHALGIRVWLSRVGLLTKSGEELIVEGKAYIDDLVDRHLLTSGLDQQQGDEQGGYGAKSVMEEKSPEFLAVESHYFAMAEHVSKTQYLQISHDLLTKLETAPNEFILDLVTNGIRRSPYYDVPVLAALPTDYVAWFLVDANTEVQMQFFQMLGNRHKHHGFEGLELEHPWLKDFHKALLALLPSTGILNRYRLNSFIARNLVPVLPSPAGA